MMNVSFLGHYAWLNNSDDLKIGGVGYLKTRSFQFDDPNTAYCLSFYYYRFGSFIQANELSVWILRDSFSKELAKLWPIQSENYKYTMDQW